MDPSDLSHLATLDALLQEVSVTRAARRLGLSTPAVSHALARLRERLGDPLLVRAGRHMVLTPRAEALRDEVHDAVSRARAVFAPPADFDPATAEAALALSVTDYVMSVLGHAFDAALAERSPQVDLRFVPNSVDDADRLRRGETDLAIGIYGALPPELRTRPLITDRFVSVIRRGHPMVRGDGATDLDTWLAHPHIQIAPRGQPGGYVDDRLAALGRSRRVARAVPFFAAALSMLEGSDRVLTVSERYAATHADPARFALLEPPLDLAPFTLSLVWHPRHDRDPAHAFIRQALVDTALALDLRAHANARRHLDPSDPTTGRPARRKRGRP